MFHPDFVMLLKIHHKLYIQITSNYQIHIKTGCVKTYKQLFH